MSMNNKQRWMGGVVLLGGGILLAALLLKGQEEITQTKAPDVAGQIQQSSNSPESEMTQLQPLTVDIETEKRLLAEQKRAREKAIAEQEAQAAEFLAMQQQAEAEAARKAAEEYAALNAHRTAAQQSSDNIPPELVEDDKAKQKRLAEEKLAAQKKQEQLKAEQLKAENAKKEAQRKATAEANKNAEEKKKAEDARKAAEKKEADRKLAEKKEQERKATEKKEAERKAAEKKKAEAEKARELLENGDKQWMVQVALAVNEANADALAAKLKAKGYKVTKSPTSKGIRLMVGPSKDRAAADNIRKKIASDESLGMKSAWVIDWVPLDKRN